MATNIAMFADKMARLAANALNDGLVQLNPHDLRDLGRVYAMSIAHVADTADWLDLPATLAATTRCRSAFGRLTGAGGLTIGKRVASEIVAHSHHLTTALSDELEKHDPYIVAPRESVLIDNGIGSFGLEVVEAVPAIRRDVADSAKCRAYELWTASVKHMMRVAEVGVAAFADDLGVVRGSSWDVTIANVLQALDSQRKVRGDAEQKQWASETAPHLISSKTRFATPPCTPR